MNNETVVSCFKCENKINSAISNITSWDAPQGVHFTGGWNFGSSLYDAMLDGVHAEIVICDGCLSKAKGTDRLRDVKVRNNDK